MKILIVEDDQFAQKFYEYLFKKTKYDILLCEDGDRIFQHLNDEIFNLIIMDINLTNTFVNEVKTDGIELSRKIKKNSETSIIPILLVTAYTKGTGGKKYFEESLADDYITKPINDYNELLLKVDQLILDK